MSANPVLEDVSPRRSGDAPPLPSPSRRIRELDGLRSIAIWLVLSVHFLFDATVTPPQVTAHIPRALLIVVEHGWLGVDLFFVLSGFLITGILLDAREAGGNGSLLRGFYERRARRILPLALIVGTILFFAYGPSYHTYFGLCAIFLANFNQYLHVATPHGAGIYWSLSVEEQFYLVWPWLVLWLPRRTLIAVAIALLIAEPAFRAIGSMHNIDGFSFLTWGRSDGLAAGALVALWFRSPSVDRPRSLRFAAVLAGLAVAITIIGMPFGLAHAGVASDALRITQANLVFSALIVFAITNAESFSVGFLRSRIMRITADLSYCIYLIHVPLADLYANVVPHAFPAIMRLSPDVATVVRTTVLIAACYFLAALSRHFIELPLLKRRPSS
ncbi:MAG TPA: acyltransferase [Candidatus Baltobacteraceae bacterium]|nr:acyltransferase [Candidatus Baltobacteraceae bacterium]